MKGPTKGASTVSTWSMLAMADDSVKEPTTGPVKEPAKDKKKENEEKVGRGEKENQRTKAAGAVSPSPPLPLSPSPPLPLYPSATPPSAAPPAPKPLSEQMKTLIRNEIAVAKIEAMFQPVKQEVSEYNDVRGQSEADKVRLSNESEATTRELPPPPEPNFEKFARQPGLSFHRSGLMSQWDIRDTAIGQSSVGEAADLRGGPVVARYAFDLGKFYPRKSGTRPEQLSPLWKDRYLFWKTADERDEVPKFEAVRDEVLKTWKRVEARKIAMEKAKSLADEARKAHKPLQVLLAGRRNVVVLNPPKFSWLPPNREDKPSETGVSEVKGLTLPGSEFMRAVFSLEPGGTAAAFNAPHSVAYAIYLADLTPSYNVRWAEFQVEPPSDYQAVARDDMLATRRAWVEEIKHSVDYKKQSARQPGDPAPTDSDEPVNFGGF